MNRHIDIQGMVKSFKAASYAYDLLYAKKEWSLAPLPDGEPIVPITAPPDVLAYIDNMWPELAAHALAELADHLNYQVYESSPIEQKMYFALRREFAHEFAFHKKNTHLLVDRRLEDISKFLVEQGKDSIYQKGDINYEIDLFLFLNSYTVEVTEDKWIIYPFFIAIECDGHDYHEKTKAQAQKDKTKDRTLKTKGLTVLRFTGTEITRTPDACAKQVRIIVENEVETFEKRLEGK